MSVLAEAKDLNKEKSQKSIPEKKAMVEKKKAEVPKQKKTKTKKKPLSKSKKLLYWKIKIFNYGNKKSRRIIEKRTR